MSSLGKELPLCKGKGRGMDRSSRARRLSSCDHKVEYKAWLHPRTVPVDGKASGRNGFRT
jgi:hypothetical protein